MTSSTASSDLEARVGNPLRRWDDLQARVQDSAVKRFADVQGDWLRLMWALDCHRIADIIPEGATTSLEALNKGKGNWFASLLQLLLQNRTSQTIGSRTNIEGFSQLHQIDVAWPARKLDPLVCAETKVTGGPAYGSKPERGPMADWSNRRKELKFAATDLKLFRRQHDTQIDHWGVWREHATPKTYFLWGARLRQGDSIDPLLEESRRLIDTYLDGAGVFAWKANGSGDMYEAVPVPRAARVTTLDDVLHRIESEIKLLVTPAGQAPGPQVPETRSGQESAADPD